MEKLALTFYPSFISKSGKKTPGVDCFWSGQARILINAKQPGQPSLALEFNTNPAPGQTVDTLPAFGYTVHLQQLDPYPQSVDAPAELAAYEAHLLVTRP